MPAMESIEVVVSTLWRVSWQTSILVLLVLLAHGLTGKRLSPAWRSALWLLVVVRLLLPVTPSSGWSLFNLTDRLAPSVASSPDPITPDDAVTRIEVPVNPWMSMRNEPSSEPMNGSSSAGVNDEALIPREWPAPRSPALPETAGRSSSNGWPVVIFWIWLAGVGLLGARLAWGAATLARRTRLEPPVHDPETHALIEECRAIIGSRVRLKLVETDQVDSPALFGFWRLSLLLPPGTFRHLNRTELRHVFLHELAHVRRGDVLLNWLTTLLQILYWFNPVIWFAFARMRADREIACDALALNRAGSIDRAAYGATILKLVSGLQSTRPAPGLVGISAGKSNLKRRIRMIASHRNPRRGAFLAAMILSTLALVSLTDARATREVEEFEDAESGGAVWFGNETDKSLEAGSDRLSNSGDLANASEDEHRRIQADKHVQAGKTFYEKGQLSEAEGEFIRAFKLDPENQAAYSYLKLISGDKYAQSNLTRRDAIQSKLRRIVLEEVVFDRLRLPDVLNDLGRVTRELDPDGHGINFLINPNVVVPATAAPVVDPTTGQIIPITPVEPVDMNGIIVRIVPPIRNASLADVLDAIVRAADKPIRYAIVDYGVVFAQAQPDSLLTLETRIFKVNPNTFLQAVEAVGTFPPGDSIPGATGDRDHGSDAVELPAANIPGDNFGFAGLPGVTSTNLAKSAQEKLRDFFHAAGVNVMPPNQIYYSDKKGVLMVRATPQELDIIQRAIEVLCAPPPRITFELLIVQISRDDSNDPESENFSKGSSEPVQSQLPLPIFRSRQVVTNSTGRDAQTVGILTERQFKAVLRQLENRPGVRMTSGPRITTLSGRETLIQHESPDGLPIITELRPVVRSNGHDIDLPLRIRAGGAEPEEAIDSPPSSEATEQRLIASTARVVRDGQTLVLGGLDPADFRSTRDIANELRDLPVVGWLFRDETVDTRGQLLLFVTPTIIDPAGNRVHGSAGRLPFDPDAIPDQRPNRSDDG